MEKSFQTRLWILPLLLAIVLCGVVAVWNWLPTSTDERPLTEEQVGPANGEQVELVIDTGEGTPLTFRSPWQAGTTVQDAIAHFADSELTFTVQGDGAGALLTELAGFANEGPGGKNWQFEVNGNWADRSFAVYELEPGDRVLWKFAESE